jgi:hypothetical protein
MNLTLKDYQRFSKKLMKLFNKYGFHVTGEALSLEDATLTIKIHTPCAEEIQSYIIDIEEESNEF